MREGKIPVDWFSRQVAQADRTDGDIDTLSNRIAHVRTWTFVANRPDWLADPEHWQAVTRGVEDKLSDALHERLTERFVDRRTSVLMRRLRENTMLETEIKKTGEVVVEGHDIGRLDGFTFAADASAGGSEAKALQAAARRRWPARSTRARSKRGAGARRASSCWPPTARCAGSATPVGKLIAGDDVLRPRVRIIADEQLTGASREAVQTRLDLWLKTHIERLLGAAVRARRRRGHHRHRARHRLPAGRGARRAGAAEGRRGRQGARPAVARDAAQIRRALRRLPPLHAGAAQAGAARLAAQLWALKHDGPEAKGLDELQRLAAQRPHLDPGRQGDAEGALPHRRLSRVRRARGPRRYPGAARRSDPSGAGLARGRRRREAGRARSTASASRSPAR